MELPRPNPMVLERRAEIVARLKEVLPADAVIDDPRGLVAYECDALTAYRCPPLAVVLPRSTEEVAAALGICHGSTVPTSGSRRRPTG